MEPERQISKTANRLLDLIYPPGLYCISCGKITDSSRTYRLCNECMAAINWNTGRCCSCCGRPLSDNDPGELCFGCSQREKSGRPFSFDRGHACTGYGAAEQSLIFALKYGGRSDIGDTLGEIMFDYMSALYTGWQLSDLYDMVIPVPIHKERKSKRGFNHAGIMAQSFAKRAGLRFEPCAIRRIRSTKPMKGLGPSERRANIEGAFEIRPYKLPALAGSRVLLIDDIFTTGATLDEIARLLKDPGTSSTDRQCMDTGGCRDRHTVGPRDPSGAARADFLAFAAAADIIVS